MKEKFGIAVVGCGRISKAHLAGIREMSEIIDLVATVDILQDRAKGRAEEFGARKWYSSTAEAFADPQIEGVILALPHYLHYPVTLEALAAGKHVLVEKPMAIRYADAVDMAKKADEAGRVLMVGQSRRYTDAVQESVRRAPEIGKIFNVTTIWNTYLDGPPTDWWKDPDKAGGLLIPLNGSHTVDYILWLMGKQPVRVWCSTYQLKQSWGAEDEVALVMNFDEGELATIHLSFNYKPHTYIRLIQGEKGTMSLEEETTLVINGETVMSGEQRPGAMAVQVREFVTATREGRQPLSSGRAVMDSIAVLNAARWSAQNKQAALVADFMK